MTLRTLRQAALAAALAAVATGAHAQVRITEVNPTGSGNGTYAADWFELTNTGASAVSLAGWRVDDNSHTFASGVALRGVSSIAAGQSIVFLEGAATATNDATLGANFINAWYGGAAPAGLTLAYYGGTGVGLSSSGDEVNLYDSSGTLQAAVGFGLATAGRTFDNQAGLNGTATLLSTLSTAGSFGAFLSANGGETGSPGLVAAPIPEPADWAMMLGGLFALATAARRRTAVRG